MGLCVQQLVAMWLVEWVVWSRQGNGGVSIVWEGWGVAVVERVVCLLLLILMGWLWQMAGSHVHMSLVVRGLVHKRRHRPVPWEVALVVHLALVPGSQFEL